MKVYLAFIMILISYPVLSADKAKVIYKYKQNQKIDLGDMEVDGKIIAPGDLSIRKQNRKSFDRELFIRTSYLKEMNSTIKHLR